MEQGDWCSLRWVDSGSVLAVPAALCFHSAAPGHGERPAGAGRGKGGNLTRVSLAVWKYTPLFDVRKLRLPPLRRLVD